MKGDCAKTCDDPEEDSGTQEKRIRKFWEEGHRKKEAGRVEEITVDLVPLLDKANGLKDTVVATQVLELERKQNREGMEPKQESLWWTRTYAKEEDGPLVIARQQLLDSFPLALSVKSFRLF